MSDWQPIPIEKMEQMLLLFQRVGYRSPSMLDISKHLGISKKTLYTYVPNKERLILLCLQQQKTTYKATLSKFQKQNTDKKTALWQLFQLFWQFYTEFPQYATNDIELNYPKALNELKQIEDLIVTDMNKYFVKQSENSQHADFVSQLIQRQIKQIAYQQFSIKNCSQSQLLEMLFQYHYNAMAF